jgi:hypothetical protein
MLPNLRSGALDSDERITQLDRFAKEWANSRGAYWYLAVGYLGCETLNLVNVLGQMFLIDKFLGYTFWTFGMDIIENSMMPAEVRVDVLSAVFPKLSKCSFRRYGPSGQIDKLDTLCTLPINFLNEKVYIVLWFWLVCVATMTTLYLAYLLTVILVPRLQVQIISSRLPRPVNQDNVISAVHSQQLNCVARMGDWLVLNLLFSNLDKWTNDQIIERINKVSHRTIVKDFREEEDLSTLNGEMKPKFMYTNSLPKTVHTPPYFLTVGQHAREPAFNQGENNKVYNVESTAATQIYRKSVIEKKEVDEDESTSETGNFKNKTHKKKSKGIVKKRRTTDSDNENNTKYSHRNRRILSKNRKTTNLSQRNRAIISASETETEEEKEKILGKQSFPTLKELDKRYNLMSMSQGANKNSLREAPTGKQFELKSATEAQPIRREELPEKDMIVQMLQKDIAKRIKTIQKVVSKDLINTDLIKVSLLSQVDPFITEYRKIIKSCPMSLIKTTYPNWTDKQIINYLWSGYIYEGPDVTNLISLADNPCLPTTIIGNLPTVIQREVPVQQDGQQQQQQQQQQGGSSTEVVGQPRPLGPIDDVVEQALPQQERQAEGDQRNEEAPQATTSKATEASSTDGVRPGGQDGAGAIAPEAQRAPKYILEHIRPELFGAKFEKAAQMQHLNEHEKRYFQERFYYNIRDRELQEEEGRQSRANPFRLSLRFGKK